MAWKDFVPLEIDIQNAILAFLSFQPNIVAWQNKNGGTYDSKKKIFRSNKGKYHRDGVSDILGFFKDSGKILVIEVKRPKGFKISPEQRLFIDEVNAAGGCGFFATSVDMVAQKLLEFQSNNSLASDCP